MPSLEQKNGGLVIWITGLSGAGKTTLARALHKHLPEAILLDGDELRQVLKTADFGFDLESRKKLALIYARMARLLASQGRTVIIATIALFHQIHAWNRENQPAYLEVFLDVPEEIRRNRDPKGLYAGERKGAVKNMVGIEIKPELPLAPHIHLDETYTPEGAAALILERLHDMNR